MTREARRSGQRDGSRPVILMQSTYIGGMDDGWWMMEERDES